MKKPLIGVVPLWDEQKGSLWMLPGYFDGLLHAGAVPVMLPLTADAATLRRLAAVCDGYLFTGGQDVQPGFYGQTAHAQCGETCPARDAMEAELLTLALQADKPVLGICRGIQFLNAALGGTLWQDLPAQHPSPVTHHQAPPYDLPAHTVKVLPDTPLHSLLGRDTLPANSCHHQAVRELAPALRAMAAAPDGIVEAVYMPAKRFVWAVQWHPEFNYKAEPTSRAIFAAFVQAARQRAARA